MGRNRRELFENEDVLRSVLRLGVPTIFGQIILVNYNMADTFFIGLTRSDAMITAVTVCMPAFMFLSAVSNLFGVGGAAAISRALGLRDAERAADACRFSVWGCTGMTLLYSLLAFVFMGPFVRTLGGADPMVFPHACLYLLITVVLGGCATSMNALFGHMVRAEGRAIEAGFGIMFGGVLNIVLDPVFMFVLLPAGHEVAGAAIATALSNLASCIYFLAVIRRGQRSRPGSCLRLLPERGMYGKAQESGIMRDILLTGLPACLMTLCENISYAVLDSLMMSAGMAYQAGVGVAKKINMLAHCMTRGMSQGVLPLIAYNFAAGNYRRMRKAVFYSAAVSVGLSAFCMAGFLIFARSFTGIFIPHAGTSLTMGAVFLRILCLGCPFSAFAYTVISFFQAVGQNRRSLVLALLRKGILDIPFMFVLHLTAEKGSIVWATPVADLICCISAAVLFFGYLHDLEGDTRMAAKEAAMPPLLRHTGQTGSV